MRVPVALLCLGLGTLINSAAATSRAASVGLAKMYWSDRVANTIRRANLDGTQVETLVQGLGEARGVAVDYLHQRIYWVDNGTNKIQRSHLDGSRIEDLVTTDLDFPSGIVLDVPNQTMYWADTNKNWIRAANLDGSNARTLVANLGDPYFLALDPLSHQLYWTDYGTDKIQRSQLDGSLVTDIVTTGLSLPRGIDLDLIHQKIYFADRDTDLLQKANFDGTNIQTWHQAVPALAAPHGVALDVANNHVYWVDNGLVTVNRADLDGANFVQLLDASSGELKAPWQIVLDLRHVTPGCTDVGPCTDEEARVRAASRIDALTQAILQHVADPALDYTSDGAVDDHDRDYLIHYVLNSKFGDANLDGAFVTEDLVQVFQAGQYEDLTPLNSVWQTGDWNGDGDFTTTDLVAAFIVGYDETAASPARSVPEPTSSVVAAIMLLTAVTQSARRRRRSGLPLSRRSLRWDSR